MFDIQIQILGSLHQLFFLSSRFDLDLFPCFQKKTNNPLAKLYSSSTMERHHLNQCLLLLNLKGNNILEHLNEVSLMIKLLTWSRILGTSPFKWVSYLGKL